MITNQIHCHVMRYRPDKPQGNNWSIVQKNMYSSVPGTLFSGRGFLPYEKVP